MDDTNPATGEATGPDAGFQDPTSLAKWTKVFLYAGVALAFVSLWELAGGPQMGGGEGSPEDCDGSRDHPTPWQKSRSRSALRSSCSPGPHRANYNARQLGAADMRFTPGWAVGWHFIPIAWFWKPYQAMTEIWRASVNARPTGARRKYRLCCGGGGACGS